MILLSLRQLEYIIAVAEHRHFSHAASACGVSQPALSKQIQEAERLLGVDLFERVRPQLLVTAAGEAVVQQAQRVLNEATVLEHIATNAQDAMSGTLSLGTIPTIAPYLLPPLLVELRRRYPKLRVVLYELQTDHLFQALRAGRVDLALLALPVAGDDFAGRSLFEEPFILATPPDHPLALPTQVRLSELRHQELMLMEEGHCFRDHALDVCSASRAIEDHRVRATSLTTLSLMVQHGLGATLIPALAVTRELARSAVVLRTFEAPAPRRQIGLRWRASSVKTSLFERVEAALLDLIDTLNEQISENLEGPTSRLVVTSAP